MMSEPQTKLDISDLKDTFLECPVCVEHFNKTDRRPRLLHSCLHAFCTQCLHQLLIKEGKGQITCPLCRRVQKVTGNADSLPVDPVRSKLVDYVQVKHKQKVLCTECEAHNAVSRCQECQSYLCEECDFVHRRHRLSRDHTIISIDDVHKQPIKSFSKGHFCPSHPKHHLEFYCTTDKQLCCLSCTVVDHKGHDFQKLEEAAALRRHELERRLQETHKLADHLKEIKEKGKIKEKLIVEAKFKSLSNINNVFDDLRTVLDQRKHQLVAAVLDKSNSLLSVAQKASAAHDQTLAIIESTDTYFTQAKEKADVVEMLQMYPAILRSMDGLQKPQQLSTLDANVDDFSSLKEDGKGIEQQIINLGIRKAEVGDAWVEVTTYLPTIEKQVREAERTTLLSRSVQWSYFDIYAVSMNDFDTISNAHIEKEFESKSRKCKVKLQTGKFQIDFNSMQGYFKDKKDVVFNVIRRDLLKEESASLFDPPKTWQQMADDDNFVACDVAYFGPEFTEVAQFFMKTVGVPTAKVLNVRRIQNRALYQQYMAKKEQLDKRNPQGTQNERRLWHGTSIDATDSINNHGYNRSYCGKNATAFGQGVYFTVNANYSASNIYSRPDSQGQKYMYLARVLSGVYVNGDSSMRTPPPKPGGKGTHDLCDSVVNDVNSPIMFVVFNDTQTYPEYLVTFKLQ